MAFPQTPRDIRVEMFINNNWVDVTSDVYTRDGISIVRGARDETSRAEPSRCTLTLNNRSGNYSPRNPVGAYYGSIGRNTPIRVAIGKDNDTFSRTVNNGWGSTNQGNAYSTISFGGTIAASDFNVAAGKGTHSVPSAINGTRIAYLPTPIYGDVDITVTVSLTVPSVTGDWLGPGGIILRGFDGNNYAQAFIGIDNTDQHIILGVYDKIGGLFFDRANGNIDSGLVYSPSQPMRIRAQIEGALIRAKVWQPNLTGEPYEWTIFGGSSYETGGWVGIESDTFSGNTNTSPVTFTYDDLVIRIPRYAGEVSYWPQRWDTSGLDVFVPIEASGIKRRLGQGTAPVNSAMFTQIMSLEGAATPVAYWPCEDGSSATQLAPAIGTYPMFVRGTTKFADFDEFACSQPIPTLNVGTWQGKVPTYTATGSVNLRFILHVSSSEPEDDFPIAQLFTSGNAPQYEVKYHTGGFLGYEVWSPGGQLFDSGPLAFFNAGETLIDTQWLISFTATQSGSNVNLDLQALKVGATTGSEWVDTVTGRTLGIATSVVIDPFQKMRDVSVGHIHVRTQSTLDTQIFDESFGFNAFSGPPEIGGETAGNRMFSLAQDEEIPFIWHGSLDETPLVGAQRPLPVLTLIEESADVDMGILHETRGELALHYRTRKHLYNQAAALTLNYAAGHVAPPLEPVDDDQQTRNDIIAKRTNGSSFELFLSAGRLSVTDPWQGGVGQYTDQITINVDFDTQLPDVAGWRLLLGTVDEARYPTITINLANPNVVAAGLDNAAMSVDVGDRIQVNNLFAALTPDPVSQIVRGYAETLGPFEHTISYVCAPASPYEVVRADAAGKMTIDSGGSTLASSVTTTATSWSVATTAGQTLWVTGAVNFDLVVEGERVTVTNITGASSPQTFTVVRSVNGVAKSHSAGVTVRLFRPSLAGF